MDTMTSASNVSITGSANADLIRATGDGITVNAISGDDYVLARGRGSYIYGGNGNDSLILLPSVASSATTSGGSGGSAGRTVTVVSTTPLLFTVARGTII